VLVIRQKQIDTIIKSSEADFVNHLVGYVKGKHAEAVAKRDDKTLREMMKGGIKRAESHDLTSVEDTQAFISKMLETAPNFDEQAQIKAVLDDEEIPPGERIEKLSPPLIPEEAWAEVKNNYDENAWFPERKKTEPSNKSRAGKHKNK